MYNLKKAISSFGSLVLVMLVMLFCIPDMQAQKKTKIKLIRADQLVGDQSTGDDLNIFVGNVIFEHDSAFLYCDSAVYNSKRNNLDAYDQVHIKVSDTMNLFGDVLNYDGNTRIATMIGNVRLVDNDATLYTDRLIFNRTTEVAYYTTGGKIISDENELVSKKGYYFTQLKDLYFKNEVVLINPDYLVESDSLMYNTSSEIAYITGPTTIQGEDEFLYAGGWMVRYQKMTSRS